MTDVHDGGVAAPPSFDLANDPIQGCQQPIVEFSPTTSDGLDQITDENLLGWATESVATSGVESSDDCGARPITAGGSSSCTFVNTVFFEGIPTLSQYGLAIMALLMLGLGMVGFRRFA